MDRCRTEVPAAGPPWADDATHLSACWLPHDMAARRNALRKDVTAEPLRRRQGPERAEALVAHANGREPGTSSEPWSARRRMATSCCGWRMWSSTSRCSSGQLFRRQRDFVHAVDGVSLEVRRGQTLGLVGETGCGKSTLARCIMRLYDLTSGRITFDGQDISTLSPDGSMRPFRREMQMIFQDPYGSLNPRRRVGSIIGDPFAIHKIGQRRRSASARSRRSWSWSG